MRRKCEDLASQRLLWLRFGMLGIGALPLHFQRRDQFRFLRSRFLAALALAVVDYSSSLLLPLSSLNQ